MATENARSAHDEGSAAPAHPAQAAGQSHNPVRRKVPARLVEASPWALGQWLLASPLLGFLAWNWLEVAYGMGSSSWRWLAMAIGGFVYAFAFVLPLGFAAHWLVTRWPRLFQNAGWDVEPLEPVAPAEQYTVRFVAHERQKAPATWARVWLRAAQGWVYLEIAAILFAGLLLIPLFLSAVDSGFGR